MTEPTKHHDPAEVAPLRLYTIRHGGTEWSLSGRHTGRTDIPLTAEGEDEARQLAPYLHGIRFSAVATSPPPAGTRNLRAGRLRAGGRDRPGSLRMGLRRLRRTALRGHSQVPSGLEHLSGRLSWRRITGRDIRPRRSSHRPASATARKHRPVFAWALRPRPGRTMDRTPRRPRAAFLAQHRVAECPLQRPASSRGAGSGIVELHAASALGARIG